MVKKISNSYSIWLHAASVGEIKIAINVAKCLISKGYDRILITSNTPSSEYVWKESNLKQIDHYYLPLDFFLLLRGLWGSISAKLLIIIETEIWPNLYYLCKKNNKNIISINTKI